MEANNIREVAALLARGVHSQQVYSRFDVEELEAGLGLWMVARGLAEAPDYLQSEEALLGKDPAKWAVTLRRIGRDEIAPAAKRCRETLARSGKELGRDPILQTELAVAAFESLSEGNPFPLAIVVAQILARGASVEDKPVAQSPSNPITTPQ